MSLGDKPLVWLQGEIKTPPFSQQARNDTIMDKSNIKRLQAQGWKFGDAAEFLGLSEQESAYVELKLALSLNLKQQRQRRQLTQTDLARLIRSSQSRVAKMEAGDPSVSVDLLIKSLLAMGVTRKELGRAIS